MILTITITAVLITRFLLFVYPNLYAFWLRWRARGRASGALVLFNNQYLENKAFFMYRFKEVPSVSYGQEIDVTLAYEYIRENYSEMILNTYQYCYLNREQNIQQFNTTLFVLSNRTIVELSGNYAEILYTSQEFTFADDLIKALCAFRPAEKKKAFEINIITFINGELTLRALDIKQTELDLDLYYNDDFKAVDAIIRERLSRQNDKGIILLHGLPGTGKTTYLRSLVGAMTKRVLFVSPSVASNLMNPEFIDLLIANPNAVLVIEDAENIIGDRKYNSNSSVSNLLNLSDGLLSDCLNVQIICTFNNALSMVDDALMRKGRLIARYEFGTLSVEKAQRLSDHLGLNQVIRKPMTLAEVTNPDELDYRVKQVNPIGFRQPVLVN